MKKLFRLIPSGSSILVVTALLSYILGLVRDRAFAHTFGASRSLDAYNAAFLLPDFLFSIFVASGIAAAFVPIFTDIWRSDRQKSNEYVNTVLAAAIGAMLLSGAFIVLFANPLSALVSPGFSETDRTITANAMRVLALSPILFAASNALGAMLVAQRRFLFYGLSPVLYNVGIIAGTILLAPHFGIRGVVMGTIAGAILHLAVRVFDAVRLGFTFHIRLSFRMPEFLQTIRLMIPKMFGHPIELAIFWGFTAIASTLGAGSIAVLNFARNFQSVPVSIIGIAIATAAFPMLAQAASERSPDKFYSVLRSSSWIIFAVSASAAFLMFLIREPLIAAVLGGSAFDTDAVKRTATVLGAFTVVIPIEALSHLFARSFYATKNTLIPVAATLVSLFVALGGGWLLVPEFDLVALPLAFAAGSFVKLLLLVLFLPSRIKGLKKKTDKR